VKTPSKSPRPASVQRQSANARRHRHHRHGGPQQPTREWLNHHGQRGVITATGSTARLVISGGMSPPGRSKECQGGVCDVPAGGVGTTAARCSLAQSVCRFFLHVHHGGARRFRSHRSGPDWTARQRPYHPGEQYRGQCGWMRSWC
jgi:hypothetical protein